MAGFCKSRKNEPETKESNLVDNSRSQIIAEDTNVDKDSFMRCAEFLGSLCSGAYGFEEDIVKF